MTIFLMALIALILDAFFGEPETIWSRYPHPATLMGRAVNLFDEILNRGSDRFKRVAGILAIIILVFGAFLLGRLIQLIPDFGVLEILCAAVLLAHRSLIEHVGDVAVGLRSSLAEGRHAVSMIVGRDSKSLDESGISRAAIESASENFSDGVIAPLFWFLLLGLPGLLVYKIVNTADSMIGYKSEEYYYFGFGAAKLDDLLNWIPARLTSGLICIANFQPKTLMEIQDDANLHRSPNAGWPESATARVLGIALAGPRSYDGVMTDDLYVNENGKKDLKADDIEDSIAIINRAWIGAAVLLVLVVILGWVF